MVCVEWACVCMNNFRYMSLAWSHKGNATRPSPTESEDSGDLKKDAVLDLCVVVGLFVHE